MAQFGGQPAYLPTQAGATPSTADPGPGGMYGGQQLGPPQQMPGIGALSQSNVAMPTGTPDRSLLGSRPPQDGGQSLADIPAGAQIAPAKMFVGGLPQSITQESLREYFERFGPVTEAFVLMDESSGRSRGFGFVTFESPASLQQVLSSRPHYLDGKQVDCKHAVLKGHMPPKSQADGGSQGGWAGRRASSSTGPDIKPGPGGAEDEEDVFLTGGGRSYLALSGDKWLEDCAEADERKIFVGGLPDVTLAEFAGFFEHFGPVADAMVMFDRKRRRQRGFGFITFATNEGVENALKYNRHPVKGKLVEVKKAHPLVLQKARAPARRERDEANARLKQQQQQAGGSPYLQSGKATAEGFSGWSTPQDQQQFAGVDSRRYTRFPEAPWNIDAERSRRLMLEAQQVWHLPPQSGALGATPGGGVRPMGAVPYHQQATLVDPFAPPPESLQQAPPAHPPDAGYGQQAPIGVWPSAPGTQSYPYQPQRSVTGGGQYGYSDPYGNPYGPDGL